jgi:hypothetical protein
MGSTDVKSTSPTNSNSESKLNPWWVTGFVDAEGLLPYFTRGGGAAPGELKTQWGVRAFFQITLHLKDKAILELIRSKLGVGKIYTAGPAAVSFEVHSIKDLKVIISHFDKYPLISQKRADFELLKIAPPRS